MANPASSRGHLHASTVLPGGVLNAQSTLPIPLATASHYGQELLDPLRLFHFARVNVPF
jgi:hypothetical protein